MGCAGVKIQQPARSRSVIKKNRKTEQSALKTSEIKKVSSYDQSKSKILYFGNEMNVSEIKPLKYKPIRSIKITDKGLENRQEDYAMEGTESRQSILILNKQILNYDIDTESGVSKTPKINTFDYGNFLNHSIKIGQPTIGTTSSEVKQTIMA